MTQLDLYPLKVQNNPSKQYCTPCKLFTHQLSFSYICLQTIAICSLRHKRVQQPAAQTFFPMCCFDYSLINKPSSDHEFRSKKSSSLKICLYTNCLFFLYSITQSFPIHVFVEGLSLTVNSKSHRGFSMSSFNATKRKHKVIFLWWTCLQFTYTSTTSRLQISQSQKSSFFRSVFQKRRKQL